MSIRRLVTALEVFYADLLVESADEKDGQRVKIAIQCDDPDFMDSGLDLQLHVANLCVFLPYTFPRRQPVVTLEVLADYALADNELLVPTYPGATEYRINRDVLDPEFSRHESGITTLTMLHMYIDAIFGALMGSAKLSIKRFGDAWARMRSLQKERLRLNSRGATPKVASSSEGPEIKMAVHSAAKHATLCPALLEKLAVALLTKGAMGLMMKQGSSFEHYALVRTLVSDGYVDA